MGQGGTVVVIAGGRSGGKVVNITCGDEVTNSSGVSAIAAVVVTRGVVTNGNAEVIQLRPAMGPPEMFTAITTVESCACPRRCCVYHGVHNYFYLDGRIAFFHTSLT